MNSTESFHEIVINNIKILPTDSTKYLGFHFNDKLNFYEQIQVTKKKTIAQRYNLRQQIPNMMTITATLLINSLIL